MISSFVVFFCGCKPCDERLEQALFDHEWASERQTERQRDALRSIVASCSIPEGGVPNRFSGNTHPAKIFFIVDEFEKAAEALRAEKVALTSRQAFELVSFAANHENSEVLNIVIASGIDPTIPEPESGITTIMYTSQTEHSPVERMTRLASLGVDPLAVSRDGFSALDFAIAGGKEEAVEQVLSWIEAALPESEKIILFSIDIAERTGDESRAQYLRDWLEVRTAVDSS